MQEPTKSPWLTLVCVGWPVLSLQSFCLNLPCSWDCRPDKHTTIVKISSKSCIILICAGKEDISDVSPGCPCHGKDTTPSPVSTVSTPTFSCVGTSAPTSCLCWIFICLFHVPERLASQIPELTLSLLPTNTLHISHAKDSGCLLI